MRFCRWRPCGERNRSLGGQQPRSVAGSLLEVYGCGLQEHMEYGQGEAVASERGPEGDLGIGPVWGAKEQHIQKSQGVSREKLTDGLGLFYVLLRGLNFTIQNRARLESCNVFGELKRLSICITFENHSVVLSKF